MIFPFAEYWTFYAVFTVGIFVVLFLDLGVLHKEASTPSVKEATLWSFFWVLVALGFNVWLYYYMLGRFETDPSLLATLGFASVEAGARQVGLEFLTGYVIEKALALDNIFVFVVIFQYFAIPPKYQHRVLVFGIIGALLFRAIFIALGAVLLQYEFVIWFFGLLLIATGIKMAFTGDHEIHPEKNPLIKLLKKFLPVTPEIHDQRFFINLAGKYVATPLFLALLLIETSDIIFALDSVPAIFAITKEPFIVFTSNVFAILGLRALYFLVADLVSRFHLLKYGLAAVLVFVGLKMIWLNHAFGGKFPITWSLGIIGLFIGGAVIASFLFPKRSTPQS